MELLAALENSGFGTWVRESPSPWAYPGLLFLHTAGLSLLAGLSTIIDLRLLGFAPRLPIAPLGRFYAVMWTAFWLDAVSGTALLIGNATTKATNPAFHLKMGFVIAAMILLTRIRRAVFAGPSAAMEEVPRRVKLLAAASLACWAGAIAAGRLMAYFGEG
jgi:hypothetical protein